MSAPRKVMIMVDWYLPGFRGGGPIRSVANITSALHQDFEFQIVTSDTDYALKTPYPDIQPDTWLPGPSGEQVWYCSREGKSYRHFRHLIGNHTFDVLYLNSLFSLRYTIFPLWIARSTKPEVAIILAPRGMLHPGALSLKARKKKLFITLLKWMGMHKQITFHATDPQEEADIRKAFGPDVQVVTAANLPRIPLPPFQPISKSVGQLRLLFLSRISEKKGVHLLLEALADLHGDVSLDLVGPDAEPGYWARCEDIIQRLPANIQVRKLPPVPPAETQALYQDYHAFAMPTLGENFGHSIFEALSAGRPVIISDQTPWRQLEAQQAGFDIPLASMQVFTAALQRLIEMDQDTWNLWAQGAHRFADTYLATTDAVALTRKMFAETLSIR